MAATTSTALDIITGALRNINVLEAGEVPNATDANDALQKLNDLIETWSLEKLTVYSSNENILYFTPGQYQYTVGNYDGGTFTGTLTAGSNIITGVTILATLEVGSTITDLSASIPPGTTVTAIGTNTVTLSNTALFAVASDTFTFTIPGDFSIPRPLRISNAFTRITSSGATGLDYQIEIVTQAKYTAIGLKGINGPWPIILFYNPTYPLGNLYFYPNPSQAGELHLWTDTIFTDFATLTQAVNLPQGYARALKTNLALELSYEYGKTPSAELIKAAMQSKAIIKALNAEPMPVAFYDGDLIHSRRADAGWIMHGGFQ